MSFRTACVSLLEAVCVSLLREGSVCSLERLLLRKCVSLYRGGCVTLRNASVSVSVCVCMCLYVSVCGGVNVHAMLYIECVLLL